MERLKPVDGLRALAVTGVIWAHIWLFFNNPSFYIVHIDVNRVLSFGGIGVDLFFVISGFCMYLMYRKKAEKFSIAAYGGFIVKRWKRIAPAFYFVVTFESLLYLFMQGVFPAKSFFSHLLFINTFNKDNVLSPPFWSLATEWHFYLILPLLFIKLRNSNEIVYRVLILSVISLGCRMVLFSSNIFLQRITINSDMIWYRFIEFGIGILAAWYYAEGKELPRWLKGNRGFLVTVMIAFAGRALMTTEVLAHLGKMAFTGRAFGEPVLTLGFALMILNVISSASIFSKLLSGRLLLFIGRISYSMYLCHWLIAYNTSAWVIKHLGITQASFYGTFVFVLLMLVPVSFICYKILEEPYFKKVSTPPAASIAVNTRVKELV